MTWLIRTTLLQSTDPDLTSKNTAQRWWLVSLKCTSNTLGICLKCNWRWRGFWQCQQLAKGCRKARSTTCWTVIELVWGTNARASGFNRGRFGWRSSLVTGVDGSVAPGSGASFECARIPIWISREHCWERKKKKKTSYANERKRKNTTERKNKNNQTNN